MLIGFSQDRRNHEISRTNTSWSIGLVFGTAKLKPRQQYQLVLNGVLADADPGCLAVVHRGWRLEVSLGMPGYPRI